MAELPSKASFSCNMSRLLQQPELSPLPFPAKCVLLAFCFILLPISLFSLYYPPTIASQGIAHRIFYIHVPIAWVALYAPFFGAVFSLLYLFRRKEKYDIYSVACLRIAYLFGIAVLVSGPLWASTEWGTYWNWKDSRLVSFFILLLSLSAYFLVRRNFYESPVQARSASALVATLSALASLLTWFAIRWIEPDTHPPSVLDKMSPPIRLSFWLSVLAYHMLFWVLLYLAIQHEKIRRLAIKSKNT